MEIIALQCTISGKINMKMLFSGERLRILEISVLHPALLFGYTYIQKPTYRIRVKEKSIFLKKCSISIAMLYVEIKFLIPAKLNSRNCYWYI